ncbi:MAG: N-acetyltransferase family protein [Candidatus Nanohalobium sp.]
MTVRHADHEDIEEIREVARESWQDTYSGIIPEETIEGIVNDWYSTKDLRQQVKEPIFFVAEVEGRIAGYVHASVKGEEAHLHRLYLRPSNQGEGLGSALYDRAEKEIVDRGGKVVKLEVMSENRKGLGFYQYKGFEEEKEEVTELNGSEIRQKVMRKKLQ